MSSMKTKLFIIMIIVVLLLTACNTAPTASPTTDPAALASQAVQTYQVQLSQTSNAAAAVTGTPIPLGFTVEPEPSITFTLPATPSIEPNIVDKAELVSQFPADNNEEGKSEKFNVVWVVKNTGPNTWNRNYKLRYYSGLAMSQRSAYNFPQDVPPGGTVRLTANMIAPNYTGHFTTTWVLTNDKGQNFYTVFLTIDIILGATRTRTKLPTKTPGTPTPGY
jgi:hypothetical protein